MSVDWNKLGNSLIPVAAIGAIAYVGYLSLEAGKIEVFIQTLAGFGALYIGYLKLKWGLDANTVVSQQASIAAKQTAATQTEVLPKLAAKIDTIQTTTASTNAAVQEVKKQVTDDTGEHQPLKP